MCARVKWYIIKYYSQSERQREKKREKEKKKKSSKIFQPVRECIKYALILCIKWIKNNHESFWKFK